MPSRKGGTIGHGENKPGSMRQDYDVRYYGDEDFVRASVFDEEKKILNTRISHLHCRITCLVVFVIVLLFLSLVLLTVSLINLQNNSKHEMQIASLRKKLNSTTVSTVRSVSISRIIITKLKLCKTSLSFQIIYGPDNYCSASSPCPLWTGNCASDSDCEPGLSCGQVRLKIRLSL